MGSEQIVAVEGHRIRLTNLEKVLYPGSGTTKADVIAYYTAISGVMLAHVRGRPATRKRWVHGVGTADDPGQVFFQKNLDDAAPEWVQRRPLKHRDHTSVYPLVNDLSTLVWLAQIASLEIHVPQWQFGRTGIQRNPDRMVLDLDPGPGVGLAECAEVARFARDILCDMGLDPLPVTSGSKGIHLYAALDGAQTSDQVSTVAHELARALEADHPDLVVSDMKKSVRDGRVLVDWSQNSGNKTTVAPYSLRGRPEPLVAAPRTWKEINSTGLAQLDFREVMRRVEQRGDPLAGLARGSLAALEPTAERMAGFERLTKYHSMRDASKTPEPMPGASRPAETVTGGQPAAQPDTAAQPGAGGQSFVIQEHHARRLHWDFRLEHDGVLVSWALPKGVPTDTAHNHLAVQTEDHPLDYGSFEGLIPAGQYGAGEVSIWDAGHFELEKWREGKEVIATLHGEKHGTARYALIHTGHDGNNWLIHLMKPDAAAAAPRTSRRTVIGAGRRRTPTVAPMLASAAPAVPSIAPAIPGSALDGDQARWAYEMKWDGIRAIAHIEGGAVRLVSRNGVDLTAAYPELSEISGEISGDAILDGEIVALGRGGRPDFSALQTRMNLAKSREIEAAARQTPVHYFVFDILQADLPEGSGTSLLARGYEERRDILNRMVSPGAHVQVPAAFDGDLAAAIATSLELGLEGVVAKRRDSRYSPGNRSQSWVKIKHHRTQEVVIGGWRPGKGRRAGGIGSLLMGIPEGDGLRYVGRVGTGFGDRELDELFTTLAPREQARSPFVDVPGSDASDARWVSPDLVAEVEFSEWTATQRLRQPSWRGWRPDKSPGDVVQE